MDVASFIGTIIWFISSYVGYLLYKRYRGFQLFREMGVPGPKPHFISGNMNELKHGTKSPATTGLRWQNQFGKVYGYFRGTLPTLVVSDFELIKRITIKDFGNFINRPFLGFAFNLSRQSLIGLEGEEWKDVRRTLSPTFSASKMKQMSNIVNKMITTLCNEIEKKCKAQEEFDIYENFQRLTLEVIGECALAIKLQCQTQYDDTFFSVLQAFMKGTGGFSISRIIAYVPGLKYFLLFYYRRTKMFKMIQHILQNLTATIQKRRLENSTQKAIDILQLMLDAGQDKDSHVDEEDSFLSTTALGQKQKKPLTDEQITANSWIFILAGFETTATALAYTAHVLTVHPDVQEKVYQEIKVQIPDDRIPTYDDANSLRYLDQVINETLRLYPPVVLFMTRICARDYKMNGITVPAGMKVEIPIYSIHHDPEIWPDPEKFDPDRFSPENKAKIHPMAHIPFGAGPRNCIGMRFALLEAKLTLIRLVRTYRLVPSAKTKDPPEITVPHMTYVPKNGIFLKVERRL